ncbi:MAG: cytochrome c3 family protein [Actinomycetota bacterium]|nr:cytochrome c3 family protein [Actinomycetota bacterium]
MSRNNTLALFAILPMLILGGCTTTEFVERDPVNPPPDAASGFVGYYDVATKQTTCGNCHVSTQGQWDNTAHASAWSALPDNPPAYCASCHTVNERGNSVDTAAGFSKVASEAYHDVQCESCHGPGFDHATTPDAGTPPLAHIGLANAGASCASCHTGEHNPFAEQWAASGHNDSAGMASPASNPSCQSCHEGRAAIRKFNGNQGTRYADSVGTKTIVCVVCHDPHGSPNPAQLRAPIDTPDPTQNLCMQCHLRNSTPTPTFTRGGRGPHAAQGPVMLGEGAGWMPPGFFFDSAGAYSSHGSTANPRLCAGCHVKSFTVEDSTGFLFQSTGHLFNPIPCVDGSGVPQAGNSCAYNSTARNWSACTTCHATASVAANLLNNQRTTVQNLVWTLWKDVDGDLSLDAFPTDSGYLAQVYQTTPAEFNGANALTTAEGALFNAMMLAEKTQYDHSDGSYGVHNPFFYEGLLAATITAMETTYGLAPPPPPIQASMERALRRPPVRWNPPRGAVRVAIRR